MPILFSQINSLYEQDNCNNLNSLNLRELINCKNILRIP